MNLNIQEKIDIIIRQTNMDDEEHIKTELNKFNNNHIELIKNYYGINTNNGNEEDTNSNSNIKSINQEIYKQIRYKLDGIMDEYRNRDDKNKKIQF